MQVAVEFLIILVLILLNGIFAMSELALMSSRKPRLQEAAGQGNAGAQRALELAAEPGRFLSTVQVGITLIGVMTGAFGGATLAREIAPFLAGIPALAPYSAALSLLLVVATVTYLSLVLGELVPKRLALSRPEQISTLIARPMHLLSLIARPLVFLLNVSSEAVMRLLRVGGGDEPPVTEEEIRIMMEEGAEYGVFAPIEEQLVDRVFRLGDRTARSLLTPRQEIVWLDLADEPPAVMQKIASHGYSRYPVADGSLDRVLGFVQVKDLVASSLAGQSFSLPANLRPTLYVPESMSAYDVLERFRNAGTHIGLVVDEYGGLAGLVTLSDIMNAIVGEMPEEEGETASAVRRADGSWLLDGSFPVDDLHDLLDAGHKGLEPGPERRYQTVGGLIMAQLGRVPDAGDVCELHGLRFEVVDMDKRRVDKVLLTQAEPAGES